MTMEKNKKTAQVFNLADNPPAIVQPAPEKADISSISNEIAMSAVANLFSEGRIEMDDSGDLTPESKQILMKYLMNIVNEA
jgi:hypothetical protein